MKARRRSDCPACGLVIHPGDTITKGARYWTCCGTDDGYRELPGSRRGYCEDAPCCGCCGPNAYGYATVYTAY